MWRLVLDTTVLVAAVRSPTGASALMLRGALDGQFTAVCSQALFVEWEAVMTRPEHLAAGRVAIADVHELLDALAGRIENVDKTWSWRPQLADEDDEMVLELAIDGRADAVVTFEAATFRNAPLRFGIGVCWQHLKMSGSGSRSFDRSFAH